MRNASFVAAILTLALSPLVGTAQTVPQDVTALQARAESGDAKAQVDLGIAYAEGDGIPADEALAVKWFRKAAENGDAAGEYALGEMYLFGRGVSADKAEAAKWIERSADHGDAHGQYNLAVMYAQGQGVSKDETAAEKWMRKAADQGLADGEFGLGSMYAHGSGVAKDEIEAAGWYRKAADQGDSAAMNNLAFLLATATDTKVRNPKEAVEVAQKAVAAEPENPTYLDTQATAYFVAGKLSEAVDSERQALKLKPESTAYKKAIEKYEAALASK